MKGRLNFTPQNIFMHWQKLLKMLAEFYYKVAV
jgi:hypothetical protein